MPLKPNGKIIGYDVELRRLGEGDVISLSTGSDRTFIAIEDDYQQTGTLVQVGNNNNTLNQTLLLLLGQRVAIPRILLMGMLKCVCYCAHNFHYRWSMHYS